MTLDFDFSPDELAFRDQIRAFLRDHLPGGVRAKVLENRALEKADYLSWQGALSRQGWMAPNWPVAYGGCGWNAMQRHIFDCECAEAGAPGVLPFGINMVGPVIIAFGSPAQKAFYLPRILSNEDWWCQGYSEPGAGSDLASLKTSARRDGDHYIVNGQKIWTTLAQYANRIFCLVRTDSGVKKQEGISFLLMDLTAPGVTVRPIRTFDGGCEVNEVFFDNVRVPIENRVGDENKGWSYAKFLLGHERSGIGAVGRSKRELTRLKYIASQQRDRAGSIWHEPRFRARVAQLEIELLALELTNLRMLSAEQAGRAPGAEASILKIKGSEVQQGLTELMLEALGPSALAAIDAPVGVAPDYAPAVAPQYFNYRKVSIYGGSNEIQKNILTQHALGL
jgi:alkylation response protein AidB-like acyl-CoA dehydrogenase